MRIVIYCGHSFEEFSPKSEEEGRGGSEEAVINMARELVKLGNEVVVYNRCGDDEGEYDGVKYENYEYFEDITADIVVFWRQPNYIWQLKDKYKAKQTYLWLHDTVPETELLKIKHFVDGVFVLSGFHASLYPNLKDKLIRTSNGIKFEDINVKRDPYKIVYGSSYDRGLKELLEMWPEIKAYEKEATLTVFYGMSMIQDESFKDEIKHLLNQEGITELGRISHKEVAEQFASAGVWCYPCWFPEISCHPAGTRVMTESGEKPIEKVGFENVLTHTGKLKPVTATMRRKAEKLLEFKIQSGDNLLCTPEHPIYVYRDGKREFIEAGKVLGSDEIIFTKPNSFGGYKLNLSYNGRKNNLPTKENSVKDGYSITPKLGWWLGYFAGDGSASVRTGKVSVLVADKHPEHTQPVLDGFRELGIEPKQRQLRGCKEYYVHSYGLARALRRDFYDNKSKKIPYGLLAIPDVFDGLMAADGSSKNNYNFSFTSTSSLLIGYAKMALSLKGFAGKAQERTHKNGNKSYTLAWTELRKFKFYHSDDKEIRRKIKGISEMSHNGWVYNLEVADDNSFVANGHTVHNCITAMKAQAYGAIPVITPTAALQETVKWGLTTREPRDHNGEMPWGTEMPSRLMDQYVNITRKALNPDYQYRFRQMMIEDSKRYSWQRVALSWDRLWKFGKSLKK